MPGEISPALESALSKALPDIYYDTSKSCYWSQDGLGGWTPVNEKVALMRLVMRHGCSLSKDKEEGGEKIKSRYSMADLVLDKIRDVNRVDFAGELAGWAQGPHVICANRILITRSAILPVPEAGDWNTIRIYLERFFGPVQLPYVYAWLKTAARAYYLKQDTQSQALILGGAMGIGKSFFQRNILTPILGRVGKPMQFMSGGSGFNADLIKAEHLMIEDEHGATDWAARKRMAAAIKGFAANKDQRLHAKGKDGIMVTTRHCLSVSLNEETHNLSALPELEDSIAEKLMLFRCQRAFDEEWPGDVGKMPEIQAAVRAEVKYFLHWLLNEYQVPAEISDFRWGVKAYHEPELVDRIDNSKPATAAWRLIERFHEVAFNEGKSVEFVPEELQDELGNDQRFRERARRLFRFDNALASFLGEINKRHPDWAWVKSNRDRPRKWVADFGASKQGGVAHGDA